MRVAEDEFEALVERALDQLPPEFGELLDNVVIVVEDRPDPEDLEELGIDDPDELLGLYRGIPLTERESSLYGTLPDQVVLYRLPILAVCHSRREVVREVRDTLVHELGHHFGLSDDEMPY